MSEKKEIELDASHTSETKLTVFSASYHDKTVRLEAMGFGSEVIKFNERSDTFSMKVDFGTMVCLRDVLNRWYEKQAIP